MKWTWQARWRRVVSAAWLVSSVGCGGSGDGAADGGNPPDGGLDATVVADSGGRSDAGFARDAFVSDAFTPADAFFAGDAGASRFDAAAARMVSCSTPAPAGARHADPPAPYSRGTCPRLMPGVNRIATAGGDRNFILVVPEGFDPATEHAPVTFLWHWLGGSANGFLETAHVQDAANRFRLIAVIPEAKGDLTFKWPFLMADTGCALDFSCNCDCRLDQELRFFDDMLACVNEQFPVNLDCVSSTGVSAGALWTAQLAPRRATHLSSMLVLSGGVGTGMPAINPATTVRPWAGTSATRVMPAYVLWGGPSDFCFLLFQDTTQRLESALSAQGAFVEECQHNCMHSVPPFAPPPGGGQFDVLWDFATKHPYWLEPGESPYLATGLPTGTPEWCGIGVGSSTIRSGDCPGTTPVLGSCR